MLNAEQKWIVHDMTDWTVDQEKAWALSQITTGICHTDSDNKCSETKQLKEKIKEKKSKVESFFIDIIRQFDKRNKNFPITSKVK